MSKNAACDNDTTPRAAAPALAVPASLGWTGSKAIKSYVKRGNADGNSNPNGNISGSRASSSGGSSNNGNSGRDEGVGSGGLSLSLSLSSSPITVRDHHHSHHHHSHRGSHREGGGDNGHHHHHHQADRHLNNRLHYGRTGSTWLAGSADTQMTATSISSTAGAEWERRHNQRLQSQRQRQTGGGQHGHGYGVSLPAQPEWVGGHVYNSTGGNAADSYVFGDDEGHSSSNNSNRNECDVAGTAYFSEPRSISRGSRGSNGKHHSRAKTSSKSGSSKSGSNKSSSNKSGSNKSNSKTNKRGTTKGSSKSDSARTGLSGFHSGSKTKAQNTHGLTLSPAKLYAAR
jgi:hypothetical protein